MRSLRESILDDETDVLDRVEQDSKIAPLKALWRTENIDRYSSFIVRDEEELDRRLSEYLTLKNGLLTIDISGALINPLTLFLHPDMLKYFKKFCIVDGGRNRIRSLDIDVTSFNSAQLKKLGECFDKSKTNLPCTFNLVTSIDIKSEIKKIYRKLKVSIRETSIQYFPEVQQYMHSIFGYFESPDDSLERLQGIRYIRNRFGEIDYEYNHVYNSGGQEDDKVWYML